MSGEAKGGGDSALRVPPMDGEMVVRSFTIVVATRGPVSVSGHLAELVENLIDLLPAGAQVRIQES